MYLKSLFIFLILHVVSSQTGRQFFTGGGCASIPGVGAPVLMISNAHKYIIDSLDNKNPHTSVNFIFQDSEGPDERGITTYKLVFQVTSNSGQKFYGIQFENINMRLNQLMMNNSISMLGKIMKIENLADNLTDIQCGDLKFLFSFYGRDPTSDLPFPAFGRNGNSVGLDLLSRIQMTHGEVNEVRLPRDCDAANINTYSVQDIIIDAFGYAPLPEMFMCLYEPIVPVHAIRIYCAEAGVEVPNSGPNSSVRYLQAIFNNASDTLTYSFAYSGSYVTDPSIVKEINIDQAATITFIKKDWVPAPGGHRGFEIITKNSDGFVLDQYGCGQTSDGQRVTETNFDGVKKVIDVHDFFGFTNVHSELSFTPQNFLMTIDVAYYDPAP